MIAISPQPVVAIEQVVSTQIQRMPEYTLVFDFLKWQVASAVVPSVKNRISEFSLLEDNWDGFGAARLDERVEKNSYKFIDAARANGYIPASADDIALTPYGTIVIDFTSETGLVSVEIGSKNIGFFTDFKEGRNHYSKGVPTSFCTIPKKLLKNLARL